MRRDGVLLTPLSAVDGRVLHSIGLVHIHLVRESTKDDERSFSQRVLIEAQTLLRATVCNALTPTEKFLILDA